MCVEIVSGVSAQHSEMPQIAPNESNHAKPIQAAIRVNYKALSIKLSASWQSTNNCLENNEGQTQKKIKAA